MTDKTMINAFVDEIQKLAETHEGLLEKLSKDTGEPDVKSPFSSSAKKFDPKVIKQQALVLQRHGKVSKAKE